MAKDYAGMGAVKPSKNRGKKLAGDRSEDKGKMERKKWGRRPSKPPKKTQVMRMFWGV